MFLVVRAERPFDDDVRFLEACVDVALADPVVQEHVPAVVDERRIGLHGRDGVEDARQLPEIDLHGAGGVAGRGGRVGHRDGHGVALVPDPVERKKRLVRCDNAHLVLAWYVARRSRST